MNTKDIERFWSKVDKSGDCWLWMGSSTRGGYGMVSIAGKNRSAHRVSYELAYDAIPEGLDILHSCDHPRCVNPAHLQAGTHTENMHDMMRKGRANFANGERINTAKLTSTQVLEIRARYAAGGVSLRQLAREYGVDHTLISLIKRGEIWRDV